MKKGVLFALIGYTIWGFFPLFFKLLHEAPAFQIMAHRVVWSFLLMAAIMLYRREMKALLAAVTWRIFGLYFIAGTLLAINWVTYVWAVNSGFVVESSLGYFINPLVSVLLGVIFLRERLRPLQWLLVILAAAGVTYLTISTGKLPWISLVLALSFGSYGLMKKLTPLGSLQGLTLETAAVFLPAFVFLIFEQTQGVGAFVNAGLGTTLLSGCYRYRHRCPVDVFLGWNPHGAIDHYRSAAIRHTYRFIHPGRGGIQRAVYQRPNCRLYHHLDRADPVYAGKLDP